MKKNLLFLCFLLASGFSAQEAISSDYFCKLSAQRKKELFEYANKIIAIKKDNPNLDNEQVLQILNDEQNEIDLYRELLGREIIEILDSASNN